MTHATSAPAEQFPRLSSTRRKLANGWNRIGEQTRFYFLTLGSIPDAVIHYRTEILRLIVQGHTNREIAEELVISHNTVLTHRKNIIAKTGIKTVSGLTFYCIRNGLISL